MPHIMAARRRGAHNPDAAGAQAARVAAALAPRVALHCTPAFQRSGAPERQRVQREDSTRSSSSTVSYSTRVPSSSCDGSIRSSGQWLRPFRQG